VFGAAATLVVVSVLAFSTASVTDGFGEPFFPWGRTLMSLPAGIWFVAFVALASTSGGRSRESLKALLLIVTAIAMLTAAYSNLLGFNRTADALASAGLAQRLVVRDTVESVERRCDALAATATTADADIVAIYNETDRVLAYACPVLHPGLTAVFPPYERRVWILRDLSEQPGPSRFLLTGVGGGPCASTPTVRCAVVESPMNGWIVESPLPTPQTLAEMGLPVQRYR
jgi:hypothetical protein